MAKRRTKTDRTAGDRDWPHLLSVGLVVGSIGGVLLLGAALRSDAPPADRHTLREIEQVETAEPESDGLEERTQVDRPRTVSLDGEGATNRAEEDLGRAVDSDAGWTAQLALLCDESRADRIVHRFGAESDLYLLPTYHDGQACFLVCWGLYDGIDDAREAAGLPGDLQSALSDPYPKRLAAVFEALR